MANAQIIIECKKTWMFYPVTFLVKITKSKVLVYLFRNVSLVNMYQGRKKIETISLSSFLDLD
jgi:hypothetical protein